MKRFQRLMLGYATDLELDGNGRMLLPQPLREYAQLDKKLVLVGQGNKLELWSEACGWPSASRRCRIPVPRPSCPKN